MKKIITFMVLIFSLLATTQVGYSYFEESNGFVMSEENPLYVINQVSLDSTKSLIPTGARLGENDTYTITFTYEVTIEEGISLDTYIDNVALMNNSLNEDTLNEVFNFDITVDHKEYVTLDNGLFKEGYEGEVITITVDVTMNDLEFFEDYDLLYGENLTFSIVLSVSNT